METIPFGVFLLLFFCASAVLSLPVAAVIAQIIERRPGKSAQEPTNTTVFLVFCVFMVLSCVVLAIWDPKF